MMRSNLLPMPGVVEHDVEPAELLDREVDGRLHVVGVAHVGALERDRVTELRRQLLAAPFVDVGDDDLRAFGDEPLDRRPADAAGAAGDDRDLARESSPMVRRPLSIHWSGHGSTPCRAKISSIAARSAASSVQSSARGVVVDLGDRPAPDE